MTKRLDVPAPTALDRLITSVAPRYGARRYQARVVLAMTGQYAGAKSKKASLKTWFTYAGSADADTLGDLPTLRARARDLDRNNSIAAGAKSTARTNTIGTGLKFRSQSIAIFSACPRTRPSNGNAGRRSSSICGRAPSRATSA